MAQETVATETVSLHVENVGGITETDIEFTPGVTILEGRNATNRTSLLQAIMAATGSDISALKADADEGRVELTIANTTYTRHFKRQNGAVTTSGDPYLADATLVDLFAFLLETNDARQAVARGDDLREVIMHPIDTGEIESQIEQLQSQRGSIDSQISDIDKLRNRIPDKKQKKKKMKKEIASKNSQLSNIEDDIDKIDVDLDEKREEKREFESKLEELNTTRGQLETVRRELQSQQDSLEALKEERVDLQADKEDNEEIPQERFDELQVQIDQFRNQKDQLETEVDQVQTVIQFNEDLLDGSLDIFSDLDNDSGTEAVTDQLLTDSDELVCWTCGSDIDTAQIEAMLDTLRDLRNEYMNQRNDLNEQIDELNQEHRELKEKCRQRSQIDTRLETVDEEIQDRESSIAELKTRRSELSDQVETLETEIEALQTDDQQDELLDLHKKANRLEVEIERLEAEHDDLEEEIEQLETRIAERDGLETQREEIQAEIEDLRTRIERLEQEAVDQFNDHMDAILDILDYQNLDRIWLERTEERVREGRQKVTKGRFDLHVVRSTESGTVYEDTVSHLSESEREVTGLIFALAGYLVHDVHEQAPFMLLDSVEAIDAPRLADLIEYFAEYAEYFVVALLEEDAAALDDNYLRITSI